MADRVADRVADRDAYDIDVPGVRSADHARPTTRALRAAELVAEGRPVHTWETVPIEVAELARPHPTRSEAVGEPHLAPADTPLNVHG